MEKEVGFWGEKTKPIKPNSKLPPPPPRGCGEEMDAGEFLPTFFVFLEFFRIFPILLSTFACWETPLLVEGYNMCDMPIC